LIAVGIKTREVHRKGAKDAKVSSAHDNPVNAKPQNLHIEVDEQTEFEIEQLEIGQDLADNHSPPLRPDS
jgi:hypothetical protein